MSNHDQTKARHTQAGRGQAGRDVVAPASPAASEPSRLLRATSKRRAARRTQSVTKVSRIVMGLRKIRNAVVSRPGDQPKATATGGTFVR